MTPTQIIQRAIDRLTVAAAKKRESDPTLAAQLDEEAKTIRDLQKRAFKKENPKKPGAKPTREEVHDYAAEIALPKREAEKFFDYFEGNGWKVGRGKAPMADWMAALRNWRRRWEENNPDQARAFKPQSETRNGSSFGYPDGWREWLKSKGLPYTSYQHARNWMKEEFRKATE